MATISKNGNYFYDAGTNVDANYGPWNSQAEYLAWLSANTGLSAPRDGTMIAIKSSLGTIKKYVWENGRFCDDMYTSDRDGFDCKKYYVVREHDEISDVLITANTIYEIRHCHNLKSKTVYIPEGCTLRFVGGKFTNGSLVFRDTVINADYQGIFSSSVSLSGSVKSVVRPEFFEEASDYTKIFNEIFNLGATVELVSGKTYQVGGVSENIEVENKNITLNGNGATIKRVKSITNYGKITFKTSKSSSYNVVEITNVERGERSSVPRLKVAGSSFEIGDVLKIYSNDDVPFKNDGNQVCGEYINVVDVETYSGYQYVYIQTKLYYTYTGTTQVARLTKTNVIVRDLTFINDNFASIYFERLHAPLISNVRISRSLNVPCILAIGCFNPRFDNIVVNTASDGIGGINGDGKVGYGIGGSFNQGLVLTNSTFCGLRHAYTTGGNDMNAKAETDWLYKGCERNISITNCHAYDCQLAFDTHSAGIDMKVDGCTIYGGTLVESRIPQVMVSNSKAVNGGLFYGAAYCDDTHIYNCVVESSTSACGIRVKNYDTYTSEVLEVNGCTFDNMIMQLDTRIKDVIVRNTTAPIVGYVNCDRLNIKDSILNKVNKDGIIKKFGTCIMNGVDIYMAGQIDNLFWKLEEDCNIYMTAVNIISGSSATKSGLKSVLVQSESQSHVKDFYTDGVLMKSVGLVNYTNEWKGSFDDLKSHINSFLKYQDRDCVVILPETASESCNLSTVAVSQQPLRPIRVVFINGNEYAHQLPTLCDVGKTISGRGVAEMVWSGGWRWL